jgi:HSP20 family protein
MNYLTTINSPVRELERELSSLFGAFDSPLDPSCDFFGGFVPALDVSDEGDHYLVRADLPGIDKKDVEITFKDGVLSLKGEKKMEEEKKDRKYFRRETWAGSFERRVKLPETADAENIKAEMKDGVLSIVIHKKEEAKPKSIVING